MNFEIRGSNVASLVCAIELTKKGHHVTHVVSGLSRRGNHFAGIEIGQRKFDFGMVLFEPRFQLPWLSIENFENQTGGHANHFNWLAFEWLENEKFELREAKVKSRFNLSIFGDFMISDDLSFIEQISEGTRALIKAEILETQVTEGLHPRFKDQNKLRELTIFDAYHKLYGETLASFLADIAIKIGGTQALGLRASEHRRLWLPLYHPETILKALSTRDSKLQKLRFLVLKDGGVARFTELLIERLENSNLYHAVESQTAGLSMSTTGNSGFDKVVEFMSTSGDRNFPTESISTEVGVGFCHTHQDFEPSVVHSLDPNDRWFRVSISTSFPGSIIVELGYVPYSADEDELMERANECLIAMKLKSATQVEIRRHTLRLPAPQTQHVRGTESWISLGEGRTEVRSSPSSQNLNSQILQGLKVARYLQGERGK